MATSIDALGLRHRPAATLVLMLAAVDVVLIVCYVSASLFGFPGGFVFDLGADRGYGEFFQYAKWLWAALLLGALAISQRSWVAGAWMLACLYLLVDDAFILHERAGWAIRDMVPGQPGWAVHLGELAFVSGVGLILAIIIAIAHRWSKPEMRSVSAVLLPLFAALVFFGVAIDAVHHLLFPSPITRSFFTTIEDGGEMLVLSVIVAFLFAVVACAHRPQLTGWLSGLVRRRPSMAPAQERLEAETHRPGASHR